MMLTPLRGPVVPWLFLHGDYDAYGRKWVRFRAVRLLGALWLVIRQRRGLQGAQQYKPRALRWIVDNTSADVTVDPPIIVCRSKLDGAYIGTPEELVRMLRWGVKYFLVRPGCTVASIGYDTRRRKWHGWSHRARGIFDTAAEAESFAESVR